MPFDSRDACEDEQSRRAERYRLLLQRLQEWNQQDAADDGRLADLLQEELAADRGVRLRNDPELERILTQP